MYACTRAHGVAHAVTSWKEEPLFKKFIALALTAACSHMHRARW